MARYSKGKYALGICDRTGQQYPLNKMKKEWNGSMVGPDQYEPKHPQLDPIKRQADAQAVQNPRPDRVEPLEVKVGRTRLDGDSYYPLIMSVHVGQVTVTTT